MVPITPLEIRFWTKVNCDGPIPKKRPELGQCWIWEAGKNEAGYGRIGLGGRAGGNDYAHRVSYEMCVGPIPEGKEIDHLCRNKSCVNPNHLEAVPPRTNIIRGPSRNMQARLNGMCIHGHLLTPDNTLIIHESRKNGKAVRRCKKCRDEESKRSRLAHPYQRVENPKGRGATHHSAKLTEADVIEIRRLHKEQGIGCAELGRRFHIAPSGASGIILRKTWKHIV